MDVGLVTCPLWPELDPDSRLLIPALQERGWSATPVTWSDPGVDWSAYQVCVVRSTWDYETQREAYVAWAERAAASTRLWNPPEVLRWNTDKRYLLDLARRGVPIVPTVALEPGATLPFDWLRQTWQAERLMLKPAVAAGGRHMTVLSAASDVPPPAPRAMLVQPFLDRVAAEGELSMVYFGLSFSHAVRKRACPGEFRVQIEHGGTYTQVEPTELELADADRVLQAIGKPLLYARIDFVQGSKGEWLLSEAEVTEPSLYHKVVPDSASRLAAHIAHMLAERPVGSGL
jgi:glutathione synthase/RimK-type ligase-like ATP-grasp enzyme